jgi:hypothetical protein
MNVNEKEPLAQIQEAISASEPGSLFLPARI